jgi:hypothetical protein
VSSFQREIQRSAERIREGIRSVQPLHSRRGDQLKVIDQELREIGNELAGLRAPGGTDRRIRREKGRRLLPCDRVYLMVQ